MWKKIIFIVLLLLAEFSLGYYSMVINDRLFTRFIFFLFSAGIVCLLVIKGIRFLLPRADINREEIQDKT